MCVNEFRQLSILDKETYKIYLPNNYKVFWLSIDKF